MIDSMSERLREWGLWVGIGLAWGILLRGDQRCEAADSVVDSPQVAAQGLAREYEYVEEVERDLPLRQLKPLHITNVRGDISVHGWSLDKLRIKFRKKVVAASPIQATRFLSLMDYRYVSSEPSLEITSQYSKDLSIGERLKEEDHSKVRLEMEIYAPSQLKLQMWGVDGALNLKGWTGLAELRARAGVVRVEGFKGDTVSLTCESCSAQFKQVRGSIRSATGGGSVELSQVQGGHVYVETIQGSIQSADVKGDQLYTTKQGLIQGAGLKGKIEFHAENSTVSLADIDGVLSGYLESGVMNAHVKSWRASDQATIETLAADVNLTLPREFSATVDVWSKQGKSEIQFSVVEAADPNVMGPLPMGRVYGRVRQGGQLLRVLSDTGALRLRREAL
jgi:hypothetical protein